jgi:hypothetical protein
MLTSHTPGDDERAVEVGVLTSPTNRRTFLKWSGTAAAAALVAACDQPPTEPSSTVTPSMAGAQTAGATGSVTIDLSSDLGILNFAYALEQLEAAFYLQVVDHLYSGVTGEEEEILRDIKRHEVVHREFFQAALAGAAIPKLTVDFSSVDFGSRDQVLLTAKALEDTGVGAYNGAAQFLRSPDYLVVAGKIVSVEARHASAIRDVLGRSFAPQAFDSALTFEQVLRRAGPFITTDVKLTHSPTAALAATRSSTAEEIDS